MPKPTRAAIAALAALVAGAAMAPVADARTPTYVERGGFNTYLQHPTTLTFSVDGDLAGLRLRWTHWGASTATARGSVYEREGYPTYGSKTVPGTIVLSALRRCGAASYYTRYTIHAIGPLPFRPPSNRLLTPCDAG